MRYEKLISLNICALRFNPDKRQGREQEQGIGRSCFMTAAPSTRSTHTGLPLPLCSWLRMWMEGASVAVEIANLRVFILMSFYFDFNASSKCVRRFLIFFPASPSFSSSLRLSLLPSPLSLSSLLPSPPPSPSSSSLYTSIL